MDFLEVFLISIRIENFKAIARLQQVPIRPITLVFGPNSAGKSSLLHSLLLARHALQHGSFDVYNTKVGEEVIDLGGFQQYIHRGDLKKKIRLGIDLNGNKLALLLDELRTENWEGIGESHDWQQAFAAIKSIGITLSVGVDSTLQLTPRIENYEVDINGEVFLCLKNRGDNKYIVERYQLDNSIFHFICNAISKLKDSSTDEDSILEIKKNVSEIMAEMIVEGEAIPHRIYELDQSSNVELMKGQTIFASLRMFLPGIIGELLFGINKMLKAELSQLEYLGPLRTYPPRKLLFDKQTWAKSEEGLGESSYIWNILLQDNSVRDAVNNWLGDPTRLQTPYKLSVRNLISPESRRIYNRLQIVVDSIYKKIFPENELEHESDQGQLKENSSAFVTENKNLDIGAFIEEVVETITDPDLANFKQLLLLDCRYDPPLPVSHRDIGIGISQVLPVLVNAYASKNSLVTIEQPELHLHPGLQAELGDLFIESALGENQNTFIIETHSEHLILRILRRIRETSEGNLAENLPSITPDNVQVIYAKPTSNGTIFYNLPISEDGDFVENWPDGFFTERAKEFL